MQPSHSRSASSPSPRFSRVVVALTLGIATSIGLAGCNKFPFPTAPSLPPGLHWYLTFADEFDLHAVNANKWDTCFYFVDDIDGAPGCTQPELANVFRADDVLPQTDGTLYLRAQMRPTVAYGKPYTYTSGMLSSFGHYSFQYGYAEIRMKANRGRGLWDAFWLMPASKKTAFEIDVLEILGHQTDVVHTTLHYTNPVGDRLFTGQPFTSTTDLAADFHTYAVNWTEDALVWYVDGIERFRQTEHIPQEPMYLIYTLAAGDATSWPGEPDATTPLPSDTVIDYIRVYQYHP